MNQLKLLTPLYRPDTGTTLPRLNAALARWRRFSHISFSGPESNAWQWSSFHFMQPVAGLVARGGLIGAGVGVWDKLGFRVGVRVGDGVGGVGGGVYYAQLTWVRLLQ